MVANVRRTALSRKSKHRRDSVRTAPVAATGTSQAVPRAVADGTSPPDRNRRRWLTVVAGIGVVIGLAAMFMALRDRPPPAAAPIAAAPVAPPRFVGGAACAGCHAKEQAAWHGSQHDLAMQVADDKSVLGNFSGAKFGYAGVTSTFFRRDGKFYVNTDGPDGRLADYEIKYAFGVAPLQQYLIELPGGRMQALGIAWDSRPREKGGQRWFHLYPGQSIKAGDPLHWTGIGQNWNFQCAECHSTNLRKNFDAATGTFKTTWSELDVSCEACHGPGSNHVAWARREGDWKAHDGAGKGLPLALDERRGVTWVPDAASGNARRSAPRGTAREVEMCARCHGRASRFTDDYVHGKPPGDSHRLALIDEGLYWNDGQMRDEVYNWGSFVQSRMFAEGVTCSDCHDPHTLALRAEGNAVCGRCHQPAKYDNTAHTHHAQGTPGAACAACHMPTTTYMVVDPRHDHSMRIPRPDLSAKLGVPNACNQCHVKRSAQWAADALVAWVGKTPVGYQGFADALAAGASGAPGARGALLAIIDDRTQPAIVRASALARLGRWLTPTLADAVSRALNDSDPDVRRAAVGALANAGPAVQQRYLPRMLDDPVRVVRIDAARALAGGAEAGLPTERRAAFTSALDEYVAAQTYIADRPEGRMNLGNLHAARGDAQRAIAEFRAAIALDPTFVAAYANLADLYRARGAERDAEAALREGLSRNPGAAVLRHALGLSLARQKRTAESLDALREAARLAPDDARFAYVYAVALHSAGQPRDGAEGAGVGAETAPVRPRPAIGSRAFHGAGRESRRGARLRQGAARARSGEPRVRRALEADRADGPALVQRGSRSDATAILAGARVDLDVVAGRDEQRNLDFGARRELGRLHHLARRVALHRRLRVLHFTDDRGGKLDGDRLALVERELASEALGEVTDRVAEVVRFDLVLVVLVVHEYVERIGEIRVRDFLALQLDDVELLVGAVDRLRARSGQEVLELHLDDRRVAARFVELGLLDHHRVLPDHDHVAGADFLCSFHQGTCIAIRG